MKTRSRASSQHVLLMPLNLSILAQIVLITSTSHSLARYFSLTLTILADSINKPQSRLLESVNVCVLGSCAGDPAPVTLHTVKWRDDSWFTSKLQEVCNISHPFDIIYTILNFRRSNLKSLSISLIGNESQKIIMEKKFHLKKPQNVF
jgi:hypothetical protein